MKIILCEDEAVERRKMTEHLERYGKKSDTPIMICAYENAEELLFKIEEWNDANLLILDIQMREMNGLELARTIRKQGNHVPIMFVTGYENYVFAGYEVEAIAYLMKPVKEELLFQYLDRAASKQEEYILLGGAEDRHREKVSDLLYFESIGHYIKVAAKNKNYEYKEQLGVLVEQMEHYGFLQCHRSFCVHIAHISQITKKELVMDNGDHIPIARGKWEYVNQKYLEYYKSRLPI